MCVLFSPHKRIPEQHPQGFVEFELIPRFFPKVSTLFGDASYQQLFRNSIRSKKCTEAQQVGGSRTLLLDLLERERPGGGNCLGIVEHEATMPRQQFFVVRLVKVEVILQAACGLNYVSAGLDEGQR